MRAVILLTLLACPSLGEAQAAPTARMWEGHPSIKAIRQLASAIDHDSATFAATKDSVLCPKAASRLEARLWIDSTGRPHRYRMSRGSGASAPEARYYYDAAGQLRLIETSNGGKRTDWEERVYYAADGRLLYRDSRRLEGPGRAEGFEPKPIYTPAEHMDHLCDTR